MSTIVRLEGLRGEVNRCPVQRRNLRNILRAEGYRSHEGENLSDVVMRAYGIAALLEQQSMYIYENDMVAGSARGLLCGERDYNEEEFSAADKISARYPDRGFWQNADHFAPDYETFLREGVSGTILRIDSSIQHYQGDKERTDFLTAAKITMQALARHLELWSARFSCASEQSNSGEQKSRYAEIASVCSALSRRAPETFREALQLVWICHTAFYYEGRYAMAFGRMDQYLYPYYLHDVSAGILTRDQALELVACTLYKIREAWYFGGDNVCNIAIGGVKPVDGEDATNELSFVILEAVGACNIPGPNLSARLHKKTEKNFLDACLQVIGQGIGYPALMNDEINIPALCRMGYSLTDCRNYCMVGCVENFIQGKQPPWSDGRYNTLLYLEYALNNGHSFLDGKLRGVETGDPENFSSMDELKRAFVIQMEAGARQYMDQFSKGNTCMDPLTSQSPFLSCFCQDCIGRGLDINRGGTTYPTAHGACLMGIATVADSLAAIDCLVFTEHRFTLGKLRKMLCSNFEGYEAERQMLLSAPKYGNGEELPDHYAVWFVDVQAEIFDHYRTPDGGRVYVAIASNISNIPAGKEIGATPDGRLARAPLSDAASPMHGMDKNGPTAVIESLSKPDYRKVACGTVVNQKYSTGMFRDSVKRAKLAAMISAYFSMGGQEIQINSVSRTTLVEAQRHPEDYGNLVVRVSGFSAYYTLLSPEVQNDILARTEHE